MSRHEKIDEVVSRILVLLIAEGPLLATRLPSSRTCSWFLYSSDTHGYVPAGRIVGLSTGSAKPSTTSVYGVHDICAQDDGC